MESVMNDNHSVLQVTQLQHLNELSAAQNILVLLRALNTSDLTFQYMLLTKETCADIEQMAQSLFTMEHGDEMRLTPQEAKEYLEHCAALKEYANG